MKNPFPILLVSTLFYLNSCLNPQSNNVAEQSQTVETPPIQVDTPPSVSTVQNDALMPLKLPPLVSHKVAQTRCSLPFVVTIDSSEKRISETAFSKKSQIFTFKTNIETVLRATEGTTLTVPADCFETEMGNILRGDVRLEIKEFLKTSDMILANLVTQSDEKYLETGGMIHLNATDMNGNPVKIRSDKDIKITLPRAPKSEDKQLFYGNPQTNGSINWTLAKPRVDSFTAPVYTIVDQSPEFPNGQAALFRYIQQRLVYPKVARENEIEGTVYVNFTVSTNGSIYNVKVRRGIGGGCNEEAARIVKSMPRWKPGRSGGVRVPVQYTLPVRFRLDDKNIPTRDSLTEFKTDSLSFAQDSAHLDKLLEMDDAQEYIMRTQRLGWINCDRFWDLQNTQRTDLVVWNNKSDAEIRLVFKNYRSIIAAWSNTEKKAHFAGVPIGQPVFIVATSPEGGKFNVSVTETVISKDQSATIELKEVDKQAFLKELHRLDSINE